ncbi:MAG: hypothetical protein CFE44_09175 [Burkholderiales bacterium PBB4]|nr:MAG: hypothetical protein CFE44_09175 [Burkholderiales bacterium PBB4]
MADATWQDPTQVNRLSIDMGATSPVFDYCLKGADIGKSTALSLHALGLNVRYLTGGIEAWKAAGLPLQPKGAAT